MGEKFSEQINIAMEVHELLEFPRFVQFFLEGKRLVGWIFGTDGFIFALWEWDLFWPQNPPPCKSPFESCGKNAHGWPLRGSSLPPPRPRVVCEPGIGLISWRFEGCTVGAGELRKRRALCGKGLFIDFFRGGFSTSWAEKLWQKKLHTASTYNLTEVNSGEVFLLEYSERGHSSLTTSLRHFQWNWCFLFGKIHIVFSKNSNVDQTQ